MSVPSKTPPRCSSKAQTAAPRAAPQHSRRRRSLHLACFRVCAAPIASAACPARRSRPGIPCILASPIPSSSHSPSSEKCTRTHRISKSPQNEAFTRLSSRALYQLLRLRPGLLRSVLNRAAAELRQQRSRIRSCLRRHPKHMR